MPSTRRSSPPSGKQRLEDLESVFRALSHASRRQILMVLNARGGRMTAGEIAARFSCTWPTTSRHLRVLENAGLVEVSKRGREWLYTLASERLAAVVGDWLAWFEPGADPGGKAARAPGRATRRRASS